VASSRLHRLADGFGDLVRLPRGETNTPVAVAYGDEGVEREATATFHDLGDAVDRDDVLDQLRTTFARCALLVATAIPALGVSALASLAATAPVTTATSAAAWTTAAALAATATLTAASLATATTAAGARARRPAGATGWRA
jgi:hypothetical protein